MFLGARRRSSSENAPLLNDIQGSSDYEEPNYGAISRRVSTQTSGDFKNDLVEEEFDSLEKSCSDNSGIHLKKQLNLLDGVGILIGSIIGSGIFISPTGVIMYAGSVGASLVIWVLSGIISTIGALCYAELGTMIPKSGGEFAYISDVFGSLPGFMYIWVALIVIMPTGNAIVSLTSANYALQPFFPNCDKPPYIAVKLLAGLITVFLTYLNCVSVRMVAKIQDTFTIAKVFSLIVIIGAGGYHLGNGHTENYNNPFDNTNLKMSSLSIAFYQGLFSYAGWSCLNVVVEELKDPHKNLLWAILISLPLVNVIYFLTNVAYFAVLSPAEILSSEAVAVSFGNRMLGVMAWIIPLFVVASTIGSLTGGIFSSSRLVFVGARQGHLPEALSLINVENITPVPSLIFLGFLSLIMLVTSDIQKLINYASFTETIFVLMSITALLTERYRHPERPRPIKIWIGLPLIYFLVCFFLVVLPIAESPIEIVVASALILSGIPVYFIFVNGEIKSESIKSIKGKLTRTVQLLTNSLPQRKVS